MIALVDVFAPKYIYENIGVYRLIAYLENRNIPVKIFHIYTDAKKEETAKIIEELSKYEVVGFSIYHSTVEYISKLCEGIKEKKPNCYIVLGSKFATSIAEKLLEKIIYADAISLGDGEYALERIHEFVLNGMRKEIGNDSTIMTRDSKENKVACNININDIPKPTRNADIIRRVSYATILTTNKCVGQCSFCITKSHKCDNKIYIRSADDVVSELNDIYDKTKNRFFFIVDGSFEDPGKRGKEKINSYIQALYKNEQKYAFIAYVKANSFKTDDDINLLRRMRSVGFNQLFIGIEAGNYDDLVLYNKQASIEDNYNIIHITQECDIHPIIGFINFNPYTTPDRLQQNYEFLQYVKNFQMSRYIIHLGVYENTPIYHKLREDKILNDSYSYSNVYGYNFIDPIISNISEFIRNNFLNHSIYQEEVNLFNFIHYYYAQKILRPEIIFMYEEKWQEITSQFYYLNSDYFAKLYKELNIGYAIDRYNEFTHSLSLLYKDIDKLKLQIMKKTLR